MLIRNSIRYATGPVVQFLSLTTAGVTQNEGNAGTTAFQYTVSRSGSTAGAISCDWAVTGSGGSPASADDFVGGVFPSGTLNFADGDASKTITVNVAGDTTNESDEGFTVTLSNPIGCSLGTSTATGTITNDDTPPAYSAEATAYFAAMTVQPDATRKGLIDTLISGLKTDGIWAKLDWLVILAAHDAQAARLNAVNTAKSLSLVNSPTFTTDRGYQGDGSTALLDFGETEAAGGTNLASNDSTHRSVYVNLQGNAAVTTVTGDNTTSFRTSITAGGSGGAETFRVNDATSSAAQTSTGKVGHRIASRTGAAVKRFFFNGTRTADLTTASTGMAALNMRLMGNNTTSCSDRLALATTGAGLTDTECANLYSRVNTFLTAIGAN